MKKALIAIVLIILVGAVAYVYVTRPVEAPSEPPLVTSPIVPQDENTSVYRTTSDSLVSFWIDELLNGKPKNVLGTTTAVVGEVAITGNVIEIGEMKIDARTFITDSPQRNGALARLILKAETPGNEYIVFVPKSNDFTGTIEEGKELSFKAVGDLRIAGVTKPATFNVKMTRSGTALTGTAETKIKRADYNLVIPNLSFIANVQEEFPVAVKVVAERI